MSATNPRGAVIAAVVGAAAAEERCTCAGGRHDEANPYCRRRSVPASYPPCVREPWVCARCNGALCGVDRCPMGGEHDPGDSDRPCPRCGASPR